MKLESRTFVIMATLVGILTCPVGVAAQNANSKIITFDAPGSGAGSGQGTGCFGCTFAINQWGAITGSYLDANNVFHGFLRGPNGKFTTFEVPGADTTPGSFNGTTAQSINDLGEIAGYFNDATGTGAWVPAQSLGFLYNI